MESFSFYQGKQNTEAGSELKTLGVHWLSEPLVAILWVQISVFKSTMEACVDDIVRPLWKLINLNFGA